MKTGKERMAIQKFGDSFVKKGVLNVLQVSKR